MTVDQSSMVLSDESPSADSIIPSGEATIPITRAWNADLGELSIIPNGYPNFKKSSHYDGSFG